MTSEDKQDPAWDDGDWERPASSSEYQSLRSGRLIATPPLRDLLGTQEIKESSNILSTMQINANETSEIDHLSALDAARGTKSKSHTVSLILSIFLTIAVFFVTGVPLNLGSGGALSLEAHSVPRNVAKPHQVSAHSPKQVAHTEETEETHATNVVPVSEEISVTDSAVLAAENTKFSAIFSPEAKFLEAPPAERQVPTEVIPLKGWFIQAGSKESSTEAEQIKNDLQGRGYTVNIEAVRVKERSFSRILIGPYDSRQNAADQLKELRQKAAVESGSFVKEIR